MCMHNCWGRTIRSSVLGASWTLPYVALLSAVFNLYPFTVINHNN